MAPILTIATGVLATAYAFLRLLLYVTQDAREPPTLETGIPFISPLIGMIREKSRFHVRLRDTYKLPIYTLRLPFSRIYIVNSTELIPVVQKQWRTINFAALVSNVGDLVGMSKAAMKVMRQDLTTEHGFNVSWPKLIMPVMSPGKELDAINRKTIEIFADELEKLRGRGVVRVGLGQWSRQIMVTATTEAIWGPENPYRDAGVAEAWRVFESGFMSLLVSPLPSLLFPKLFRARELVAAAMIDYIRKGGYKTASGLVKKRFEHHHDLFHLSLEDIGRGEVGNTFAVLGNSTPCLLWVLYQIFSDDKVLDDIRRELTTLVLENDEKEGGTISTIDLTSIRTSCPILLSTFQETLRCRAVVSGPRMILEDVLLEGRILLKKGNMLMIPAPVQHTDISAWGEDASEFDHMRFARKLGPGQKKPNRVAFRAFGGGHVLCPGRHFASTEIMALAGLLVLQFDVVPLAGKWAEPICKNSPVQAGFPIPDVDIEVELRPRDPSKKWKVTFSGSEEMMEIVSEDILEMEK